MTEDVEWRLKQAKVRYLPDLQELVKLIVSSAGYKNISVEFKSAKNSRAHYSRQSITIALEHLEHGTEKAWATAIHEACHFLVYRKDRHAKPHGQLFKEYETYWLREFGLYPVYNRAYTKALTTLEGTLVWASRSYKETE